jgi:hypothetical protein
MLRMPLVHNRHCLADSFAASKTALRLRIAGAVAVFTQVRCVATWLGGI